MIRRFIYIRKDSTYYKDVLITTETSYRWLKNKGSNGSAWSRIHWLESELAMKNYREVNFVDYVKKL